MANTPRPRLSDLVRFYDSLHLLHSRCDGVKVLRGCSERRPWPRRGVYFFYENGECRTNTGNGPREVRVGTHALTRTSRTTLWKRLAQHRGEIKTGGGNHRGSIFRLLIGQALSRRYSYECATWGQGQSASGEVRQVERQFEREVSAFIGQMPFLWLAVDDEPGQDSQRGYIERNAIALLSNYEKAVIDPPSSSWLGHSSDRERVRKSGLWNQNHVEEHYDPRFLDRMESLIRMP